MARLLAVEVRSDDHGRPAVELEPRLIELGFVEGARVEVLHQGLFGRDPIAVRVNEATVALRRREAAAITTEIRQLASQGCSKAEIARRLGVGERSVYRMLASAG